MKKYRFGVKYTTVEYFEIERDDPIEARRDAWARARRRAEVQELDVERVSYALEEGEIYG